jgi:Flp pilus assembly secretin CpaC
MDMHRSRLVELGILTSVCALAFASPLQAEDIHVPPDQARVVTFNAPAKTVFVGNSAIADVTVIDSTHAFVLGKTLGTTNIVALDAAGHEFLNEHVVVIAQPGAMITVQHGQGQMTLSCSSEHCASTVTPGDEKKPTERTDSPTIAQQFTAREEIAGKAAAGGNSAPSGGAGAQQ